MANFNHPIFTNATLHGEALVPFAARWLTRVIVERLVNNAVDAGLGIVSEQFEVWRDATPEQMGMSSPQALAGALRIHFNEDENETVTIDDSVTNKVMAELQSRDDGALAFADMLGEQEDEFIFNAQLGGQLVSGGRVVGCMLAGLQDENNIFKRGNFEGDSRPANFIRRCSTKSSDGKRVSREPHEWAYVRTSGQWGRIMRLAVDWAEQIQDGQITTENGYTQEYLNQAANAAAAIENQDISSDQQDYSYGNFVDMVRTRKALERYRKIQQTVRSANVRAVLGMLGTNRNNFTTLLENRGEWLDVLEEMVNFRVIRGSRQTGTIPAALQVNLTPTVND